MIQAERERLLALVRGDSDQAPTARDAQQIEELLNADDELANIVAKLRGDAGSAVPPVPPVDAARWEQTWRSVRAARRDLSVGRVRLLWLRTGLAAAACVLMAVSWGLMQRGGQTSAEPRLWPVAQARLESLEVFGGDTSIVFESGNADGVAIIWVLEDDGELS